MGVDGNKSTTTLEYYLIVMGVGVERYKLTRQVAVI